MHLTRGSGKWVVKLIFLFLDKERQHFKIGKPFSRTDALEDCKIIYKIMMEHWLLMDKLIGSEPI
jgi:hypothetical protein